jgi:hypothetical protein
MAGAFLLLVAGCRVVDPEVTGMRLVVSWPGAVSVDQLAVSLFDEAGQMLGPRELRPPTAGAPLAPGADLVVLLAEGQAGRKVRFAVEGLVNGQLVGTAAGETVVAGAHLQEVQVSLGGGADGGVAGAAGAAQPCAGGGCR